MTLISTTKGKKNWPNLVSLSLRNALRQPSLPNPNNSPAPYTWETWHTLTRLAAEEIHAANPDVLIFLPGMDSGTNLTPLVQRLPLPPGNTTVFSPSSFASMGGGDFLDKLVLEIQTFEPAQDCKIFESQLYDLGFETLDSASAESSRNVLPLVMTQFGFLQSNGTYRNVYATCLAEYLPRQRAGWMLWVLAGSYYVREEVFEAEEGMGVLDGDWEGWREPEYVEGVLKPMVEASLLGGGDDVKKDSGGEGRRVVEGRLWMFCVAFSMSFMLLSGR